MEKDTSGARAVYEHAIEALRRSRIRSHPSDRKHLPRMDEPYECVEQHADLVRSVLSESQEFFKACDLLSKQIDDRRIELIVPCQFKERACKFERYSTARHGQREAHLGEQVPVLTLGKCRGAPREEVPAKA